jgi:hypothetical protein
MAAVIVFLIAVLKSGLLLNPPRIRLEGLPDAAAKNAA